jgi:deoxyribodipyrimidine photo-lyase
MTVHTVWQSSLLAPEALPFAVADMPQIFTTFRQRIEAAGLQPLPPLAAPRTLPPAPDVMPLPKEMPGWRENPWALLGVTDDIAHEVAADLRTEVSTRPLKDDEHSHFKGGQSHALAHLQSYLTPPWPDRYKQTRNALQGLHTSSHWSPGLATGAVSARTVWAALHAYEQQHGANDGTYWLWFELLWRDNFRFLHLQHGRQLYAARGLSSLPRPKHFPKDFQRWCDGNTGEPIVDAGMRELASTGYTSNRMRQIVASYLVHDLSCDWRAGAAWFESQLIDFDIYSNQGNWLYISGRGTDPRAGRRFNPTKQTQDHDPQGRYRRQWLGA